MNETYEQEIDLKWLIYRVLRGWRTIVVWAIIVGVVLGVGSFGLNYVKINDPGYIEAEQENFEREHTSWVATGENFKAQLENIAEARAEQEEYNEKSVLMQIDPLREFHASFELYVNYDYRIMPDMTYQNIDLSDRILKAYATYMTNGELYQKIIDGVSFDIERRYLSEILEVSIDYNTNMISVSVTQQSAEYCQEILAIGKAALLEKYNDVKSTIAEHTLSDINASAYETVNLALQETQKENRQRITDLDMSLQEVNEEYLKWKRQPEPQAVFTINSEECCQDAHHRWRGWCSGGSGYHCVRCTYVRQAFKSGGCQEPFWSAYCGPAAGNKGEETVCVCIPLVQRIWRHYCHTGGL